MLLVIHLGLEESDLEISPSLPRSVVDDDGGEVVEAGSRVGAPRLVEVGEEVVGHVEAAQRELHVRVQLRPREGRPPETLQVQAEHLDR